MLGTSVIENRDVNTNMYCTVDHNIIIYTLVLRKINFENH